MNSNEVYQIILYAVAKNKSQGYVSPEDFNTVLMPVAQRSYLDYLLGEYQKYQPKRPMAPVEFGGNERIRDSIAPLIYGVVLTPNTTSGIAPFPSDYEYVDSMWTQYGFYRIRFTQQNALWSTYQSSIDPIQQNPVYLLRNEGIQFYPENIGFARMSYVRKPPAIIWGYTLDENDLPVWNPLTSQDPVWSDSDIMNIIVRALAIVGCNLQLGVVMGYAQEIKNNGQ